MGTSGTTVFCYSADVERTGEKIGCMDIDHIVGGYVGEIERGYNHGMVINNVW